MWLKRLSVQVVSYVYEPDSYVPLARLDATGASTELGGMGTTADPVAAENLQAKSASSAHTTGAGSYQNNSVPANDGSGRDWQALDDPRPTQPLKVANGNHRICEVFYFHTDQVGLPEELTNSQGKLCWQASYKTWGNTVSEEWEVRSTTGQKVNALDEGAKPSSEQNLRFQGQYLDRDTGLHYNTFRFYDADIGRFISPDPIGLEGGANLHSYSPNPISWIDPYGWTPTPLNKPGFYVYGLYKPGAKTPYYVGHTEQLPTAREGQHAKTGRLGNGELRVLRGQDGKLTYSQAKGYEQAYREKYGTKKGFPGNVIEPIDKARTDSRGKSHYKNYRAAAKNIGIKPTKGKC